MMAGDGDSNSALSEVLTADVIEQNACAICCSIFYKIRGGQRG